MMTCDQHDYVEIACMYHYPVKLTLKSGAELKGRPLDTQRNKLQQECIKMQLEDSISLVLLDSMVQMEAQIDNPHFHVIRFHSAN